MVWCKQKVVMLSIMLHDKSQGHSYF